MSAVKAFRKAFELIKKKNWDKMYVSVDIHETILKPTWSKELSNKFYDYSREVLRHLSNREDVCLILWTCSSPESIEEYLELFSFHKINFTYVNCNPEVKSTYYADFNSKFYSNVLLDDKSGFDPEEWLDLFIFFNLNTH